MVTRRLSYGAISLAFTRWNVLKTRTQLPICSQRILPPVPVTVMSTLYNVRPFITLSLILWWRLYACINTPDLHPLRILLAT